MLVQVYTWGSDTGSNPVVFFLHGAGECALTWKLTCEYLTGKTAAFLVAFDIRGHGNTRVSGDEYDLSLSTLSRDLVNLKKSLLGDTVRDIFLVGHSMGGSVVVETASLKLLQKVLGVVVIDVVEETALDSLKFMKSILLKRPTEFSSRQEAVDWITHSKKFNSKVSAENTVDSLLDSLKWRTDLFKSEQFWNGFFELTLDWFTGLSEKFLKCPCSRLLVLAGTERLDKPLLIAQMQGKFQLKLLPDASHYVHENNYAELGDELAAFIDRNKSFVIKKYDAKGFPIN